MLQQRTEHRHPLEIHHYTSYCLVTASSITLIVFSTHATNTRGITPVTVLALLSISHGTTTPLSTFTYNRTTRRLDGLGFGPWREVFHASQCLMVGKSWTRFSHVAFVSVIVSCLSIQLLFLTNHKLRFGSSPVSLFLTSMEA